MKVLLFIGASSGIGAATAKLFSKLGASVALTGRSAANLESVGKECQGSNKVTMATWGIAFFGIKFYI